MKNYRVELEKRNIVSNNYYECGSLDEAREWADEQIKADRSDFGYSNRSITGYEIYCNDLRIISATVQIDGVTEYNYKRKSNLLRKPF